MKSILVGVRNNFLSRFFKPDDLDLLSAVNGHGFEDLFIQSVKKIHTFDTVMEKVIKNTKSFLGSLGSYKDILRA